MRGPSLAPATSRRHSPAHSGDISLVVGSETQHPLPDSRVDHAQLSSTRAYE
jgi:hypothetical protein